MSLGRFYSRINDAISPLLSGAGDLRTFLDSKVIALEAPDNLEQYPVHLAGFVLATNLCARLYPRLRINAPVMVAQECKSVALAINPLCEVDTNVGPTDGAMSWAMPARTASAVAVAPAGWDVLVDRPDCAVIRPSNILVSLAAATIGVGELFRSIFAEFLPAGRVHQTPGALNLLTLGDSRADLPSLPSDIDIGRVYLAGAGAVGQAAIYTLARVAARGTLVVVDPEQIALSNLQRYVLTTDGDVGASKCSLAVRALRGSRIEALCHEASWGEDGVGGDKADVVCAAVDTEAVRMEIQAGLPRSTYNAWTQPADLGWSRHEDFGKAPCLACLYWPNRPRPSQHELIASAVGQAELRVLAYLTVKVPVGQPLRPEQIPKLPNMPVPADSGSWVERSLLEDMATSLRIPAGEIEHWRDKQLGDLYREGICGGALVRSHVREVSVEMAVPLAHQSVLAGIMLATQVLIASSPELTRYRPTATEARLNVLSGLPQIAARPRQRSEGCICSDTDFVERYRSKWKR